MKVKKKRRRPAGLGLLGGKGKKVTDQISFIFLQLTLFSR